MISTFSASYDHLHLLKHPFYQDWMEGKLSTETLSTYATQYYYHVLRFPRYVSAIHSLCEDDDQRQELLNNLNDEEGTHYGVSHPELWLQFANGLGVSSAEVRAATPCSSIQQVAETFFYFARKSYHEGLGALYAYEAQVPEIAESKIEGLKNRYGVTDEKTLQFFEVHRTADVEHREVILRILEALPENEKAEAQQAAQAASQTLWNFLTEMHQPAGVSC